MSTPIQEQRKEPRRRAQGGVRVWFANPQRVEIEGQLVDLSDSGFRMSHACAQLEAGQTVQFSHPEAAGQARVIWNRIVSGGVESGFLVVAR